MKKFIPVLLMMFAVCAPALAQEKDSVEVRYVPNAFKDNWELNIQGGVNYMFIGLYPGSMDTNLKHRVIGGGGELTATKWFNPFFAGRFGWYGGYIKNAFDEKMMDNYFHMDLMWDWCNQFGGYRPDRLYHFIPYLHGGVAHNTISHTSIAGGAGLYNRFDVNDKFAMSVDLRGFIAPGNKYDPTINGGIVGSLSLMVGVTYRFGEQTKWATKKAAETSYKSDLEKLQAKYNALLQEADESKKQLADAKTVTETIKQIAQVDTAAIKESILTGVGEMTVYYNINSADLAGLEKLHLATYLSIIRMSDPENHIQYTVVGRADSKTGSLAYNEALAQRRAENLKAELIKLGIAEDHITVKSEVVNTGDARADRASSVLFSK